jgi:hypothetical protein
MTTIKCGWPGCPAESSQPFTDGWAICELNFGMGHGYLCPHHAHAYDALSVNEQPPTPL